MIFIQFVLAVIEIRHKKSQKFNTNQRKIQQMILIYNCPLSYMVKRDFTAYENLAMTSNTFILVRVEHLLNAFEKQGEETLHKSLVM